MQYPALGNPGLAVFVPAFGAGPVAQLMIDGEPGWQHTRRKYALAAGINRCDTATGYCDGASERNLGRRLRELGAADQVHVITKVRLYPTDLSDPYAAARSSLESRVERLGLNQLALLPLAQTRTAAPDALAVEDLWGPKGLLHALIRVRKAGLADHLAITAIGSPAATEALLATGEFPAAQVPYHLLNPSAGRSMTPGSVDQDHGCLIDARLRHSVGVLAIRVLAGRRWQANRPAHAADRRVIFPWTCTNQTWIVRPQSQPACRPAGLSLNSPCGLWSEIAKSVRPLWALLLPRKSTMWPAQRRSARHQLKRSRS